MRACASNLSNIIFFLKKVGLPCVQATGYAYSATTHGLGGCLAFRECRLDEQRLRLTLVKLELYENTVSKRFARR